MRSADAVARERLRRGRMCAISSPASAISSAGRRIVALVAEDAIEVMAEPKIDGLSRGAALRARPAGARRDARRRRHRRGRDREHPHARRACRRCSRGKGWPEIDRDPRRSLYGARRLFRAQRGARGRRRAGLRQSAQRRRRLAAPARSGDHRAPAAQILRLCLGRGERAVRRDP